MSGRAAWRLESLGFTDVYRYTAGKTDWLAHGWPRAGRLAGFPTAGDVLHRDVPTCWLSDPVGEAAARARATGEDICVVVNERRIVLGTLGKQALDGDPTQPAEEVMKEGPVTFRPNELLADVALRLRQGKVKRVLVTTSDGELLGILLREDAERRTGVTSAAATEHSQHTARA